MCGVRSTFVVRLECGPILFCLSLGLLRGAQCGNFLSSISKNLSDFFLLPSLGMTEVAHTEVPKFDGRARPFANYEEKVTLRKRTPALGPEKKAAHLLLHMSDVARKVCLPVGRDVIGNLDGAEQILKIPRERFAPDAIDSVFQDIANLSASSGRSRLRTRTLRNLKCCYKKRSRA